jgi:hypothetical protein
MIKVIRSKDNALDFYKDGQWFYDITASRCSTPTKALELIRDMTSKTWITREILQVVVYFAMQCCSENKEKP